MPRDFRLYLEDILEAIRKIERYVEGVSFEKFVADSMRVDAVLRNLQIIGEAVKRIPEEVKQERPSIEWRKIGALRDIVAHEYFGVDLEIVWDIVQSQLATLRHSISIVLDEER